MWRVAAARATAATLGINYLQKKAENCGIVGVVGLAHDADYPTVLGLLLEIIYA